MRYLFCSLKSKIKMREDPWFNSGYLFFQNLSSMIPVRVLNPKPHDLIWDMCAAPGSKTSQIAASLAPDQLMIATEKIRSRYYKLREVLKRAGVTCVKTHLMDARRYRVDENNKFDKILLDAPCSSEGMFDVNHAKSFAYWSVRKNPGNENKTKGVIDDCIP